VRKVAWLQSACALAVAITMVTIPPSSFGADEGHRLRIVDAFSEGQSSGSEIYAVPDEQVKKVMNNQPSDTQSQRRLCQTMTSNPCDQPTGLSLRIYLPQCSESIMSYCIDSVALANSDGVLKTGSLIGYTDARTYPANSKFGIPEAATTSRWRFTGVPNKAGTETYAVKVLLDGFLSADSPNLYVFQVSGLIEPYSEITSSQNSNAECTSWQSGASCGIRQDFLEGQIAKLSVRLPNSITGWIHGRLKSATISVEKYDGNQNTVTVTAENVRVPEMNTVFSDSQIDALPNPSFFRPNGKKWNSVNAGNPASLEWIKQLAKPLGDRATGEHTTWSFSTIPSNNGNNKCFTNQNQLAGLVMTNSLVYSPNAPDFDGQQLNYQVGGLHFQADGKTPNYGTYDLLIRSDTARCLYNFTDAPLSASVSISYPDGAEAKIATTTLSEKNGWLHLGASGFTFSSPTLRVKLSGVPKTLPQPKTTANTPNQTSAPKSKNYTITCVKGKITKKIITPKQQCPTGWKKK
jgi:hypothetical protein